MQIKKQELVYKVVFAPLKKQQMCAGSDPEASHTRGLGQQHREPCHPQSSEWGADGPECAGTEKTEYVGRGHAVQGFPDKEEDFVVLRCGPGSRGRCCRDQATRQQAQWQLSQLYSIHIVIQGKYKLKGETKSLLQLHVSLGVISWCAGGLVSARWGSEKHHVCLLLRELTWWQTCETRWVLLDWCYVACDAQRLAEQFPAHAGDSDVDSVKLVLKSKLNDTLKIQSAVSSLCFSLFMYFFIKYTCGDF